MPSIQFPHTKPLLRTGVFASVVILLTALSTTETETRNVPAPLSYLLLQVDSHLAFPCQNRSKTRTTHRVQRQLANAAPIAPSVRRRVKGHHLQCHYLRTVTIHGGRSSKVESRKGSAQQKHFLPALEQRLPHRHPLHPALPKTVTSIAPTGALPAV